MRKGDRAGRNEEGREGWRERERKGGTEDLVSTGAVVIRVMSNGESSRAVLCCAVLLLDPNTPLSITHSRD